MPDIRHRAVLGFDFGLSHIGVAAGQALTCTAQPLEVLKAKDGAPQWPQLEALVAQWRPRCVVVGLPLNMDGSESDISLRARKFAARLHGRLGLPVYLYDERLSSFAAKERLAEGAASRAAAQAESGRRSRSRPRRDGRLDAVAAQLILESWLVEDSPPGEVLG